MQSIRKTSQEWATLFARRDGPVIRIHYPIGKNQRSCRKPVCASTAKHPMISPAKSAPKTTSANEMMTVCFSEGTRNGSLISVAGFLKSKTDERATSFRSEGSQKTLKITQEDRLATLADLMLKY